jgi:uncharacterized protein (DUF1800 family)
MALDRAVVALSRFGFGPRPGDAQRIAADPRAALLAELKPEYVAINNPLLQTTADALTEADELRKAKVAAKNAVPGTAQATPGAAGAPATPAAPKPDPQAIQDAKNPKAAAKQSIPALAQLKQQAAAQGIEAPARVYATEVQVRVERAIALPVGYAERLVDFWANHFAVAVNTRQEVRILAGAYEREAIRPHVFGKFSDMLVAATQHAAMLAYLNNAQSIGPDSPLGKRSGKGLNENHARELMELHTIGVDGGYSQQDVTQFANILTGWSTSRGMGGDKGAIGAFMFRPQAHEPGVFTVLGKAYPQPGENAGMAVLMDLAHSPKTDDHIATQMVRYFVADDPPPSEVAAVSKAWKDSDGDLLKVSQALVNHDDAWTAAGKFKTPQLYLVSALRALHVNPKPQFVLQVMKTLGQMPWDPPSPQGFDDRTATWLAPDAMTTRLDVAEQLSALADPKLDPSVLLDDITLGGASKETTQAVARAESRAQGLALLLMSPEFQRS